jgi:hypothetical protein
MGQGLDDFCKELNHKGFEFNVMREFNSEFYSNALSQIDVTIYAGLDEGAISILDSIAAGIPVILSRTGFHLDIPFNPNIEFFDTPYELGALLLEKSQRYSSLRSSLRVNTNSDYAKETLSGMNIRMAG